MDFRISLKCTTEVDPDSGFELAKVKNIKVFLLPGMADGSNLVDMEKLKSICENKAINILATHKPPKDI